MACHPTNPVEPGFPSRRAPTFGEPAARARPISSAALLKGASSALIEHRGETYCLRQTKSGKLLLTK